MSFRRLRVGLLGAAVLAVGACGGTGSSALPSITIPSALPAVALEGFCADFQSKLAASWPNIDASTAATLAPLVTQWASKPEMASVQADVTTIATWVSQAATTTSVASPPPDVTTAFDHLKTFADANC